MGYRCPKCGEPLVHFSPTALVSQILSYNLKDIIELQTLLAQQGVSVTFATAEIVFEEPTPSLGKTAIGSHDPLE